MILLAVAVRAAAAVLAVGGGIWAVPAAAVLTAAVIAGILPGAVAKAAVTNGARLEAPGTFLALLWFAGGLIRPGRAGGASSSAGPSSIEYLRRLERHRSSSSTTGALPAEAADHRTPQKSFAVKPIKPISGVADMSGVALGLMAGPRFWLTAVVLAPAMSLLPDITHMTFQRTFAPKPFQIFQELEWKRDLDAEMSRRLGLHVPAASPPPSQPPSRREATQI
ncbi:hypothetical protein TSOC_007270 [Tetrabaena socialis]|uniref:Uncharacterized protein n=1 Tax=Tetrabaena socialis TaxID=47790 RepID=A0A2J8A1G1_9CHLO|nr:hypothetical protein TSOC_007270 [Tetrabaena socialis]|eukprot:PNH06353.1 hypothetical protein TSOC_007270 [Tetrabaena socialis]